MGIDIGLHSEHGISRLESLKFCSTGGRAYTQLSPEEQAATVQAFNNFPKTQETGVKLAGNKYFTLQAEGRSIYVKKGVSGRPLIMVPETSTVL